ncbi:hypothetical protein ACFC1R_28015 [Kitasatospora sp. NPDC056138]|uniref:Rv1733c family protein n=1 Tax=Kitasatospora sp. NPDC056138 TaxID=3345724 RepID=UPI0035DE726E
MSAASTTRRRSATRMTLWRHVRRAVGRDSNPLCRCLDRARSRLVLALVFAFAGALALASAVSLLVVHSERGAALQTARHRHLVTATIVGPALSDGAGTTAEATWVRPPSEPQRGPVDAPGDVRVGATVPVWVNDQGRLAAPVRSDDEIAADAASIGLMALAGLSLSVEALYTYRRHMLDRRAQNGWGTEWEQVEPLWSGRMHGRPGGGA